MKGLTAVCGPCVRAQAGAAIAATYFVNKEKAARAISEPSDVPTDGPDGPDDAPHDDKVRAPRDTYATGASVLHICNTDAPVTHML
eukprot:4942091-Pyramimonas_sp.AAC.1